jgi:predicted Zn-dependent protease
VEINKKAFEYSVTVLIFLILFMTGCGAVLQSVEKDKEQGAEIAQHIEADLGIYIDTERTVNLKQIGQRLVEVNPDQTFDYEFAILDQWVPNAFALPGGYIYISRGLLALRYNEDELACVVGHEIIHVSRRHSARQMAKARVPTLFALPGSMLQRGGAVSKSLGNLLMAPAAVIGGAYLAAHSRQDEYEADQHGQRLAADVGYDPAALASILVRLEDFTEAYTGKARIPGFFDTHPSTPDRVSRVERDAGLINWQRQAGVTANSADYLNSLDGLLVGENPAMGVIQHGNFLHPELDLFITLPKDWQVLHTRQALFALAPQKDGLLVMGIAGKGTDAEQAAEQFAEELDREIRTKPDESRSAQIGNLSAHVLTYTDDSGEEPMHMHFLWVAYRGLLYQFIGLAPERYRPVLRKTALSFRPLRAKEKASIQETRLRVISARSGETLRQLSQRTDNVWDLKITAVINGLDESTKLENGQLVKIAVSQPYTWGK